jgi:hypothetical protein
VAHLERLPLGTPYPAVAERLGALYGADPSSCELVIDVTGVGRPVLDLLRQAGHSPIAVSITGTGSERLDREDLIWRVPKARLMTPLASAIEAGRLSFAPDMPERETFKAELGAFHRKLNQRGHTVFGGKGEHDDTVIARCPGSVEGGMVAKPSGNGGRFNRTFPRPPGAPARSREQSPASSHGRGMRQLGREACFSRFLPLSLSLRAPDASSTYPLKK